MTRITNFGRKKTYLKAGFGDGGGGGDSADVDNSEKIDHGESLPASAGPSSANESNPIKKPRKRRKKIKNADNVADKVNDEGNKGEPSGEENTKKWEDSSKLSDNKGKKAKSGLKRERMNKNYDKAVSSERRRLKRITDRYANTTCLRCRQKGHTVKTCSQAESQLESNEDENVKPKPAPAVGICYRCGSRRHNLSRCKKPMNPDNPLPFASCFVCSKTGHLASTCPQNAGKGVYPNGGSCKLCKQTSHLAKDCPLQTREVVSQNALMLGDIQTEGGADEDDFHVIKRRRNALQKEETIIKKLGDKADYIHKKANPKVVVFK